MPVLFSSTEAWIHFARLTCVLNGLLLVQIYQLQNGRITKLLDLYPIRQLGIISYAAYLFHPLINLSELADYLGYQVHLRRSLTMLADLLRPLCWLLPRGEFSSNPCEDGWLPELHRSRTGTGPPEIRAHQMSRVNSARVQFTAPAIYSHTPIGRDRWSRHYRTCWE